jgi:hypothetical protein
MNLNFRPECAAGAGPRARGRGGRDCRCYGPYFAGDGITRRLRKARNVRLYILLSIYHICNICHGVTTTGLYAWQTVADLPLLWQTEG